MKLLTGVAFAFLALIALSMAKAGDMATALAAGALALLLGGSVVATLGRGRQGPTLAEVDKQGWSIIAVPIMLVAIVAMALYMAGDEASAIAIGRTLFSALNGR